MNPQDWLNRWQTLEVAIQSVRDTIPEAEKQTPWQITIDTMLGSLHGFAEKQFNFFFNGFVQKTPYLATSPAYPAAYALRLTIDQIEYDLSVLRRARDQRLSGLNAAKELHTLRLADRLTYRALQPMFRLFLDKGRGKELRFLENTTALTYFKKSMSVRVIPYAPVAVVGIPQTCTDPDKNPQDFLAIPHEAGHYVFWHAQHDKVPLRSLIQMALPPEPAWRQAWLEEIFSDVYGCLVAGPAIARDFQDLMMDNKELFEDDGEHPIGALRPYVYSDTMRELHDRFGDFPSAPDKLDDRWKALLKTRVPGDSFIPKVGENTAVTITDARLLIREAIVIILDHLQPVLAVLAASRWTLEEHANHPDEIETALYEIFKTSVLEKLSDEDNPPLLITASALEAMSTTHSGCREAAEIENVIIVNDSPSQAYWLELFADVLSEKGLQLPPSVWDNMLVNGGWAAGGPEGSGTPPN